MAQILQKRWVWSMVVMLATQIQVARSGLAVSYCSPDNNAGNYSPFYSEYMSTGLCGDHCQGSYAFAIVQGNNCWCSSYIPADQDNTYSCNQDCPGISSEWCGNTDAGLYGYFGLPGGKPIGTSGGGGSSHPSSTAAASSYYSSYVAPSSSSSPSPPSPSPPSPPSTSSSPSPTPTEVYTSVTTVTGQVRTVLVTPTASSAATFGQATSSGSKGLSSGTVAGIVIGVAIGLGLLIGAIVWFCLRRKHRQRLENMSDEGSFSAERAGGSSNGTGPIPSRQVSQLSSAGLLTKIPRINTQGLGGGLDLRSPDTVNSNTDRRSVGTDQRLNPWALYQQDDHNSSVSLQDNQDYSRQLRVANPDF